MLFSFRGVHDEGLSKGVRVPLGSKRLGHPSFCTLLTIPDRAEDYGNYMFLPLNICFVGDPL